MAFESELPIWQKLGTKPPDSILNTEGWGAGKKPPADWFDWLFNRNYLALKELQEKSYALPSSGIPKTDLATAVQTSLGKADSALQSVEAASTTTAGIVKIEDSVTSTSVTTAAAPKSVKAVKDDLDTYKADYVSKVCSIHRDSQRIRYQSIPCHISIRRGTGFCREDKR